MTANLTIADVTALNEIINAATTTAKVAWVNTDGDIRFGTARAITAAWGNSSYITSSHDIRDGYLRITSREGWENWLIVSDLMESYHDGHFRIYDW
jgi:hypothetical protein